MAGNLAFFILGTLAGFLGTAASVWWQRQDARQRWRLNNCYGPRRVK